MAVVCKSTCGHLDINMSTCQIARMTFFPLCVPGTINSKRLQIFNLTSLTKSEDVLSATLHYYIGDLQNGTQGCSRTKSCRRHGPRRHSHIHMIIWSFASVDNQTRTLGHFRINVSTLYRDFISWQWKDITRVVSQTKNHDQLLIGIQVTSMGPHPWKTLLSDRSPYILVYANDSAISEPESVVATLQRHQLVGGEGAASHGFHRALLSERNDTEQERPQPRHKRSVNVLLPLQNNELPGPEYPYETTGWDEASPYEPFENKQARRPRKKTRKNQRHKMPLLQFDEQTIKKARKKQWNEPRNCARRYLKVDFADIGWSEWIISPKSFDAYYCSGSCQFPMPKVSPARPVALALVPKTGDMCRSAEQNDLGSFAQPPAFRLTRLFCFPPHPLLYRQETHFSQEMVLRQFL